MFKQFLNSKKSRLVFILLPLTILLTQYQNCSDVSFESIPESSDLGSSSDDPSTPVDPGTPTPMTKIFSADHTFSSTQKKALDIIWVVDNSGSMTAEAAHVRANLLAFIEKIAASADVTLSVISAISASGTGVDFPALSIPNLKINQVVGSTNGLRLLSSAICAPTSGAQHDICNSTFTAEVNVRGRLHNFLRPNSQKVVVMVTDDESSIAHTIFTSLFDSVYGLQNLTVYGWIGLGAALSPCQARTGQVYMNLATATSGGFFNVCDANWTNQFNFLAQDVAIVVNNTVAIPEAVLVGKIISVKLNNVIVSSNDYSLSAKGITFSPAAVGNLVTAKLQIEYQ